MQSGQLYIRDSNDFINKIKCLENIPSNSILVTEYVAGLSTSIPHESDLNAIKEALENRQKKSVPVSDIPQMLEFLLKNNYFRFNGNLKQQLPDTATGTKSTSPYACIFMDKLKAGFLESQKLQPMVQLQYINHIFLIWTHGKQELQQLLQELNKTHPNLKFTHESSKKRFHSSTYLLVYVMGTFIQISITKLLIAINILNTSPHLSLSRLCLFQQEHEVNKKTLKK